MWISRFSSVAVGVEQTVRTEPVLLGLSTIAFQLTPTSAVAPNTADNSGKPYEMRRPPQ